MEAIAEANPETPVCLFMGTMPAAAAATARRAWGKKRYVSLGPSSFMPLVCVLWPRRKADDFMHWASHQRHLTRADDGNAAKWVRATKQQILVSVPSLVQHDDSQPTVKGGRDHVPWKESWRQALFLSVDGSEFLSP